MASKSSSISHPLVPLNSSSAKNTAAKETTVQPAIYAIYNSGVSRPTVPQTPLVRKARAILFDGPKPTLSSFDDCDADGIPSSVDVATPTQSVASSFATAEKVSYVAINYDSSGENSSPPYALSCRTPSALSSSGENTSPPYAASSSAATSPASSSFQAYTSPPNSPKPTPTPMTIKKSSSSSSSSSEKSEFRKMNDYNSKSFESPPPKMTASSSNSSTSMLTPPSKKRSGESEWGTPEQDNSSPLKKSKTAAETPAPTRSVSDFGTSPDALVPLYFQQTGKVLRGATYEIAEDGKVIAKGGTPMQLTRLSSTGCNKHVFLRNDGGKKTVIKFANESFLNEMPPAYFRNSCFTKLTLFQYNQVISAIPKESALEVSTLIGTDGYQEWEYVDGVNLEKFIPIFKGIKSRQEIETSPCKDILYAIQHFFHLAVVLDTPLDMKPDNFIVVTKDGRRKLSMVDMMDKPDYFTTEDLKKATDSETGGDGPLTYLKMGLELCSGNNTVLYKFFIESIEVASNIPSRYQDLCKAALLTFQYGAVYEGKPLVEEVVPDWLRFANVE